MQVLRWQKQGVVQVICRHLETLFSWLSVLEGKGPRKSRAWILRLAIDQVEEHGEMADECAELYYLYGSALTMEVSPLVQ